jgi:hypothetical protein
MGGMSAYTVVCFQRYDLCGHALHLPDLWQIIPSTLEMNYSAYNYTGKTPVCQEIWELCMCQAFIGKVSFDERRVFKMQLPGLCPVYVYSKAHRLTAALA